MLSTLRISLFRLNGDPLRNPKAESIVFCSAISFRVGFQTSGCLNQSLSRGRGEDALIVVGLAHAGKHEQSHESYI